MLVLNEIPIKDRNIFWNLFSADRERINYAAEQYLSRDSEASGLLKKLSENYAREGVVMPYTKQDFLREVTKEHLDLLTPDERVAGLSPNERVAGLSPNERVAGLSPDELVSDLPPDKLRIVIRKAEDRLAHVHKDDKQQPRPRAKTKRSTKRESH